MDHQTIHPPVHPRAIRILGYNRMPCADVAAAVSTVNERNRKFKNIHIITAKNILLARSRADRDRQNQFFFAFQIGLHDLFRRRARSEPESQGRPRKEGMSALSAAAKRSPEGAKSFRISFYLLEKSSRRSEIIAAPRDRPHLKVPVNFHLDALNFFVLFEQIKVIS